MIVDYNPDKSVEGGSSDAMFSEGTSDVWVHRTYGLSKQSYATLTEDDTPYLCPHCCIKKNLRGHSISDQKEIVRSPVGF